MNEWTGGQAVVEPLKAEGTQHVFGLQQARERATVDPETAFYFDQMIAAQVNVDGPLSLLEDSAALLGQSADIDARLACRLDRADRSWEESRRCCSGTGATRARACAW